MCVCVSSSSSSSRINSTDFRYSLSPFVFWPSLMTGLLESIQYPHRADKGKFFAGRLSLGCPWGRVYKRTSLMSSSLLHQLVLLEWFVRWEVSGRAGAILCGTASKICLERHLATCVVLIWLFSPKVSFL